MSNPALESMGNVIFNMQTLHTIDGKSLKTITPDKDGIFKKVPLAILRKPSRNNVQYDETSFVNGMTNPKTTFYKKLVEGGLEGEWGHPFCAGNPREIVKRVAFIDRTRLSHFFTHVNSRETEDGLLLIEGDIGTCGPYKDELVDSFADPKRNTAFSLRALTHPPTLVNGIMTKKVIALITFDAVESGGFAEASKRFMGATESLECPIPFEDFTGEDDFYRTAVGFESLQSEELFEMLGTDKIIIENSYRGVKNKNHILTSDGKRKSIFHSCYN